MKVSIHTVSHIDTRLAVGRDRDRDRFRIISPKLLELFRTQNISQPWISAVKWHFLT